MREADLSHMKCPVCFANFSGSGPCPSCLYDPSGADAKDVKAVLRAREEFRARTLQYAPETRVRLFDKLKPWLGLVLGGVLFLLWLRACSSVRWF